jgi:hypothetical protein
VARCPASTTGVSRSLRTAHDASYADALALVTITRIPCRVAGLLGGPVPGGMQGDAKDADAPGGVLYHGQHIGLAAQRRRIMSRCQHRIVSGDQGFGRRGCRGCRTAIRWRRIKISAVCHTSSRRDNRSHVVTRVMRRKVR